MHLTRSLLLLLALLSFAVECGARTVWRCVRDGSVSLSTAPEPGSRCAPRTLDDDAALLPNLWGRLGSFQGTLYRRVQDGKAVYGTRKLPGAVEVQRFAVATPASSAAHSGLGKVGKARTGVYRREFTAAARRTGVDEALLRAIAHAESGYSAQAVSAKGAKGVMQLMPGVISDYGVGDPFSAKQSILAGAKYLEALERRYQGDQVLVAAAYNAGAGAVAQYGGVPPYAETQEYVAKVGALYARYREALGMPPRSIELVPAD